MNEFNKEKQFHFVYITINLINQKLYIGKHSTNDLNDGYLGSGKLLLKALKKYGKKNFTLDILEKCSDQKTAFERERFWINFFGGGKKPHIAYNLTEGGEGNRGHRHSPETISKISHPGKLNGMFGKNHSKETKNKIRQKVIGRKHKKESIKWMSDRKKGSKNKFYGRTHTEESKEKNRLKHAKTVFELDANNNLKKMWKGVYSINQALNTTAAYSWINTNKVFKNSKWFYEEEYKNISNRSGN